MSLSGTIKQIFPKFALPGGEASIETEDFEAAWNAHAAYFADERARISAASSRRVLAIVPDEVSGEVPVTLESGENRGEPATLTVGRKLADNLHNVANPAVDPKDGSIIATRSGSRGFQLPKTLFRIENDGYIDEMPVEVLNPTGLAFSPRGELFVSNRSAGEVYVIERGEEAIPFATGLGIASGLAFDSEGVLFVGDRTGTIYRIPELGLAETFARLEPSVAAFHIAFGPDGRLYATAPGLSSYDCIYAIDKDGEVERFARGFGRPQGLAFDRDGNLYAAACYQGRHGIVRIAKTGEAEHFVACGNAVGLCFGKEGEMIIATNDSIYSIPMGVYGTLLP